MWPSSGHEDAYFFRAAVAARISSDDRKQAHQLAQAWFDANHKIPHQDLAPHRH
jgi:uncharacterized protein